MTDRSDIYKFALKYYQLFKDPKTSEEDIASGFTEDYYDLEHVAYENGLFSKTYGSLCLLDFEDLEEMLDRIDEDKVLMITDAIFERYTWIREWSNDEESIFSERNRTWFIKALRRLVGLTDPDFYSCFDTDHRLTRIKLITSIVTAERQFSQDEEVQQQLLINDSGRVTLTRYRYGADPRNYELIKKRVFTISENDAEVIMEHMADYFCETHEIVNGTNVDAWELTLKDDEGNTYKETGALANDDRYALIDLSKMIRFLLKNDDLFVFDGAPDEVETITISYERRTKVDSKLLNLEAQMDYFLWEYNETITIDINSRTIVYVRELMPGESITTTYNFIGSMEKLIESIKPDIFTKVNDSSYIDLEDAKETREYTIKVVTNKGVPRLISGEYTNESLPKDWVDFIDELYDCMFFYGKGEIFDRHLYGNGERRDNEFIFCLVSFDENNKAWFYYIADSDEYIVGDLVLVPTEKEDVINVARIISIEYYDAKDAPVPVVSTKHIIGKYRDAKAAGKA